MNYTFQEQCKILKTIIFNPGEIRVFFLYSLDKNIKILYNIIMKLVRNDKEFEALYPYSESNPKKCKHPKRYPCLVEWIEHDGGLDGDYCSCEIIYYSCEVIYLPVLKSKHFLEGFAAGVTAKPEILIGVH